MMALLTVDKLVFDLRGKRTLDGVDLVIPEGDIHALLDANDSGKKILANLIMGCDGDMSNAAQSGHFYNHDGNEIPW